MTSGPSATSRLRLAGYAAILTALAFAQSPGRIVPDTKFDLVAAPWRFLAGATHLWDPRAAFGQVQNQADGYLWPMGPFFVLGKLAALPEWVVQRLWWAVLLNLAFFGMLRLLRDLRLGRPWTQVVAAAAFVLAPRITSILGESSVELWPTALAPWVLVPLVRASERGPVVRAAALSALLVVCCGGVNATAVAAVLPAGVIWLATRSRGPRRWRLLAWWGGLTVLGTLWWLAPLVLLGRYGSPFLDYIENAGLTQAFTDVTSSLVGTSNWTAYLGGGSYAAGSSIVRTPFVLLDAAAVAALGLAGLAARDHPHRRFAVHVLLAGLVLVGLGYTGQVHGWAAGERQSWLDGALAALRNTHKFDVLVRLALSLGIAHALAVDLPDARPQLARLGRRLLVVTTALVLVGLAFPWLRGTVAAPGGFTAVPDYWRQAASYVGGRPGTTLVVPAAPFGDYTWGSTHDDVLQPYAQGPWAVRNVVPLAEPGNVRLLDEVTELLESGSPSPRLAELLSRAGVGTLLVRNDLARLLTGAPDPAYVHAALDRSPGLDRVAGFGPLVGEPAVQAAPDGTRVFRDGGLSGRYRSVEAYRVTPAVEATVSTVGTTVMGDPGAGLPLTGDDAGAGSREVVLTDGLRRQEIAFQAVRRNAAATAPAGSPALRSGAEQFHRILPDQERWQTTEAWLGDFRVTASSSQAFANADPPLDRGTGPGAAVDGDDATAWRTPPSSLPDGQWLELALTRPRDVGELRLRLADGATPVDRIRVTAGSVTRVVQPSSDGRELRVRLDAHDVSAVRVTAVAPGPFPASWGIAELGVDDLATHRILVLPEPPVGAVVEQVRLSRDPGMTACPSIGRTVVCNPLLGSSGEDGDRLDRGFRLNSQGAFTLSATGSLRRSPKVGDAWAAVQGVTVTGSRADDVGESPAAMLDGDRGTTWRASAEATIAVRLDAPRVVSSVTLDVADAAPAAKPREVEVGDGRRTVRREVVDGRVSLPDWDTSRLTIKILDWDTDAARDASSGSSLAPGISELLIDGDPVAPTTVRLPCGEGPTITSGGRTMRTGVTAPLADLLRGDSVPLSLCEAADQRLPAGTVALFADPGSALRADTVELTRPGFAPPAEQQVRPQRDGRGTPVSVRVERSDDVRLLALPQNFSTAWAATLDGRRLTPQRVDGWQQGWILPAGSQGTVRFTVPPEGAYRIGLAAGALGVLLVVATALLARRRGELLPPLAEAGVGWADHLVVVLAAGVLAGWLGLVAALGLVVAAQLRAPRGGDGWPGVAAGATLLAVAPRVVGGFATWPTAAQWCGMAAVLAVAGSLLASGPTFLSRIARDSSSR